MRKATNPSIEGGHRYDRAVRTAVITGGSSGIGLAVARALARRGGWQLILAARRPGAAGRCGRRTRRRRRRVRRHRRRCGRRTRRRRPGPRAAAICSCTRPARPRARACCRPTSRSTARPSRPTTWASCAWPRRSGRCSRRAGAASCPSSRWPARSRSPRPLPMPQPRARRSRGRARTARPRASTAWPSRSSIRDRSRRRASPRRRSCAAAGAACSSSIRSAAPSACWPPPTAARPRSSCPQWWRVAAAFQGAAPALTARVAARAWRHEPRAPAEAATA